MDPVLLVVGMVRISMFLVGLHLAFRYHHVLLAMAFTIMGSSSFVFAVSNAGGGVPKWMFQASAYLATPGAALLASGLMVVLHGIGRRPPGERNWRL